MASRAKLKPGQITSTSVTFDHVTQANERDWDFLTRIGREVGFEVSVTDGKLNFRAPASSSGAPSSGNLDAEDDLRLQVGANLLFLRAVLTAAEQVEEVQVRGWDPKQKQVVAHSEQAATASIENASGPDKMAKAFPSNPFVSTGVPYATDREVEAAAKALAEEVASGFAEMEGQARGNPKLRAGAAVHVGLLGDPFDGKYVLTSTTHRHDSDEGYVTEFVVSGRRERSLLGLTGGAGGSGGSGAGTSIDGVVVAQVDDVDDPDHQYRVRVKFPWLDDRYVSDWCRVTATGAGKDRGFVVLPEVGDEVLVAFEQGDMRRPYVVGGLYNGTDTPNLGPGSLLDASSKAVDTRLFTSRAGHQLVFQDGDRQRSITLQTAAGNKILFDDTGKVIEVTGVGDLKITADGGITIEATRAVTLKGQSVTVEAQSNVTVKGAQVAIEANGPTKVSGNPIQLN